MKKTYPKEFKGEAIRLVESGVSRIQVERDLGIGHGSVGRWIREKKNIRFFGKAGGGGPPKLCFIFRDWVVHFYFPIFGTIFNQY